MASLGGNFIENIQIQLEIEEIQLFYWLVYPCTSLRTDQPVLARSLEGRFNLLKGSKVDSGFKQVILLPQSSVEAKKYVPHDAFSLAATLGPNCGSVGPGLDYIGGLAKHQRLRACSDS
jgi:hypothetical protein